MQTSIARRLLVSLALMLAVTGAILAQIGLFWMDYSLREHTREQLRAHAESLLSALIHDEEDNRLIVNNRHHDALYSQPFSGYYFIIEVDGVPTRSRSLWDFALLEAETQPRQLLNGPNGQLLLSYQKSYRVDNAQVDVTVAEDYRPVLERFYNARRWGLSIGATALLLVILLQWRLIVHALRPLERARRQLAELESGQRNQLDAAVPEEMKPLVGQINQLLEHIDEQLKRSRNAAGNLGHALKTPLAVLSSLQARPELQQQPELLRILQEQLRIIQQRIERELSRARMAGEQHSGKLFICSREIPALLQLMEQLHGPHIRFIWLSGHELQLPFDRDDLLELLGNLLDNAGKWAHGHVQLGLKQSNRQLLIHVDDDGPGIPAAKRQLVLQRGRRQDEQTPGHGLGLAIVSDIVSALHGDIELQDSPLGGLQVRVSLPLSRQA